ncbi:MAG: hypothetical protein LBR08_07805 [Bacteroidales bacterium]|jgi:hypothetical protein|nr:hypothetical protein [Bacteroidales bacterium]
MMTEYGGLNEEGGFSLFQTCFINMPTCFKYRGIHRIFAQPDDSGSVTNPVAFGDAAYDFPCRCTVAATVKENGIACFRKTVPANLTSEHLLPLSLLNAGARPYQAAL